MKVGEYAVCIIGLGEGRPWSCRCFRSLCSLFLVSYPTYPMPSHPLFFHTSSVPNVLSHKLLLAHKRSNGRLAVSSKNLKNRSQEKKSPKETTVPSKGNKPRDCNCMINRKLSSTISKQANQKHSVGEDMLLKAHRCDFRQPTPVGY